MNGIDGKVPTFKKSKKNIYSTDKYKENLLKFKEWYEEKFEVQK